VGVPEKNPLEGSVNPGGRLLLDIMKLYGLPQPLPVTFLRPTVWSESVDGLQTDGWQSDREVVLLRAQTPISISRLNCEGKGAGRSRLPGKGSTGSDRQSRRQTAAHDNERIRGSTAARFNGGPVRTAHGPVGKG
jgi:hypothetical protein